jgi:hypothetical protein
MLAKDQAPKVLIAVKAGADCRQSRGKLWPQGHVTRPLQAEPHGSAAGKAASIFSSCAVVAAILPRSEGRGFSRRN